MRPIVVVGLILGSIALVTMLGIVIALAANKANGPARPAPVAAAPHTTAAASPTPSPSASRPSPPPSKPALVAMPNLVGKNAAVAMDELKRLGVTNVQLGSQDAEDKVVLLASNWTVTKQSTAAGAQVDPAVLVVLTCTKKA